MVGLVGVTGLAGAGQNDRGNSSFDRNRWSVIFLGQTVLYGVHARGLSGTPDDESHVRIDLRRKKGPSAFAIPYLEVVAECIGKGIPVFVDAIFKLEEFDLLASRAPSGFAR